MHSRDTRPVLLREMTGFVDDTDVDDAQPRQCTDRVCSALFFGLLLAMVYMFRGARHEGNVQKLVHGIDWMGRVCGVSENVTDAPLLYWCVSEGLVATDGICVKSCPSGASTTHRCPGTPSHTQRLSYLPNGDYRVAITVERSVSKLADSSSREAFGMYCLADEFALAALFEKSPQLNGFSEQVIVGLQGIYQRRFFLIAVGACAMAVSFALLAVLASCVDVIVYTILGAVQVLLVGAAGFFLYTGLAPGHDVFAAFTSAHHAKIISLSFAGLFGVLSLLFALFLGCSVRAFEASFYAIRRATQTIIDLPTLMLAPFLQLVIKGSALLFLLWGMGLVLSLGQIMSPPLDDFNEAGIVISGVSRRLVLSDWQWRWVIFWIFGSIWVQETVAALGQYAIAHAVVLYVLNKDEVNRVVPLTMGFVNGAVYHLGTLAFGGFVLGVVSAVTSVCSYLAKQMRDKDGQLNVASKAVCCCCSCCLEFLDEMLRLGNELAYVDTAIFGTNYPEAALNVFQLVRKYPTKFATATGVAKLVQQLGIFVVTAGGTAAAYMCLRDPSVDVYRALYSSSVLGATAASSIICFTLSSAFMMTFNTVVNVHVYCGLIREDKYNIPFGPSVFDEEGYVEMDA